MRRHVGVCALPAVFGPALTAIPLVVPLVSPTTASPKVDLSLLGLFRSLHASNQVRLALFILAYNLGNFLRRFALPSRVSHWSLSSIQLKLVKMGAKVTSHARRTVLQMAVVAIPGALFAKILARIRSLVIAPT